MIRRSNRVRKPSKARLWEQEFAFLHESEYVEKETEGSCNQKEKKYRLVEDFLIPALNNKTYGDLLKWDPYNPSCFLLSWTHKAASVWNLDHAAVFAAWDEIKGRPAPKNRLDFVDSKQRMRAALKAVKNVEGVKGGGGYRRYKILNLDDYEVLQDDALDFPIDGDENIADNTQCIFRKELSYEEYSSASSPEPPENKRKKQHSLEKQTASEVTPYHRHTRSLTQKIIEICPESQSALFEQYDEVPKQRKKNPSKRSANEAFEEESISEINSFETLTEKTEPEEKEEDTMPQKRLPQNLKKRKKRVRRFTPKKKSPSKNLRKWKRPKKVFKLNLKQFHFKKKKICEKSTIPLQYSVLENESLYWKTIDQIATHYIKQEPFDHYPADTTEIENNQSHEESNQVVPESYNSVLNPIIKQEPIEYASEESFRLEESDNGSEYEAKPDSPVSEPEMYGNAEREAHKTGHSLIADFIIPALDNKTYGDLLMWDPDDPSVFLIKWMHKAKSSWNRNEAAVFIAWDVFKGRRPPKNCLDFVDAKQRLRAAFRNLKSVQFVEEQNGYRGYRVLDFPGVESIGDRKLAVQKFDAENSVRKSPVPPRPKLKDHLKKKKRHTSTSPKMNSLTSAKFDSLTSPKLSSSTTPKLNSTELLECYHHHTRSLTRKMDEICPSPTSTLSEKSSENFMDSKESTIKKPALEKEENIVQTSKFSKTFGNELQKLDRESNSSDTLTKPKSDDRYNDTRETIKGTHPVSNFSNSWSNESDSPADNSEISSESSDWEPGTKKYVRKPRIVKHDVNNKDSPLMAKCRKSLKYFRRNHPISKVKAHNSKKSLLFKALTSKLREDEASCGTSSKNNSKQTKPVFLGESSESEDDQNQSCSITDRIDWNGKCSNNHKMSRKHISSKQKCAKRHKNLKNTFSNESLKKCQQDADSIAKDCSSAMESDSETFYLRKKNFSSKPYKTCKRGSSEPSIDEGFVFIYQKKHKKIKNNQNEMLHRGHDEDPFYQYENIIKSECQRQGAENFSYSDLSDALSSCSGSEFNEDSLDEEEIQNFLSREKMKTRILNSVKTIEMESKKECIALTPEYSVSLTQDSIANHRISTSNLGSERNFYTIDNKEDKLCKDLKSRNISYEAVNMSESKLIELQSNSNYEDASKKNLLMEFSYFVDEYNRKSQLASNNGNFIQTDCSDNSSWDIKIVDICSISNGEIKTVDVDEESLTGKSCNDSIKCITHERSLQSNQHMQSDRFLDSPKTCSQQSSSEHSLGCSTSLSICDADSLNKELLLECNPKSIDKPKSNLLIDAAEQPVANDGNSNAPAQIHETNSKNADQEENFVSSSHKDSQNSKESRKDESDVEIVEIWLKMSSNIHSEKDVKRDVVPESCDSKKHFKPNIAITENDTIQGKCDSFNKSSECISKINNVHHNKNLTVKANSGVDLSESDTLMSVENFQEKQIVSKESKKNFASADQKSAASHLDQQLQKKICIDISNDDEPNVLFDSSNMIEKICSESQGLIDKTLLSHTIKSTIHDESQVDCVILPPTSEAKKGQISVSTQFLNNAYGSNTKSSNDEIKSLTLLSALVTENSNISAGANTFQEIKNFVSKNSSDILQNKNEKLAFEIQVSESFKCLEDDCVILNDENVSSLSSEKIKKSAIINSQESKVHLESFSTNESNSDCSLVGNSEELCCVDKDDTFSGHEACTSNNSDNLDDECMILNKSIVVNDKSASQLCNEIVENCEDISNQKSPANFSNPVKDTFKKCATLHLPNEDAPEIDKNQTEFVSQESVDVEDECVILSDASESENNSSKNLQKEEHNLCLLKPDSLSVLQLISAYQKECINYQKLIQSVDISDTEIKVAMDTQAKKLELISHLVENSIGTLNPCVNNITSNPSSTASEAIKCSEDRLLVENKRSSVKLISIADLKHHMSSSKVRVIPLMPPHPRSHGSENVSKQSCMKISQQITPDSVFPFGESFTEDKTESTGESSDEKESEGMAFKCTICQRPAESACFYCCVIYYCSTECAESLANRSHYESCKDEYLSKLNVTKLHRSIAEKQPCL